MSANSCLDDARKLEAANKWVEASLEYKKLYNQNKLLINCEKIAWCLSRAGHYVESIDYLDILVKEQPLKAKWPYMIGYQYYSQKKWDMAIRWYEEALTIKKDYFVVKYRLAYSYIQICGDYKRLTKAEYWKALGHLKECHGLWESFSEEKKKRESSTYFSILFLHGKIQMDLKQFWDHSISLFQKALEIKPNDEICKYNLSKVLYLSGKYKDAKQAIPKSNKYYVRQLDAYIEAKLGNYKYAISVIENMLQKTKKSYLYCSLSEIYLLDSDLDNAYKQIMKSIELDKNNHKIQYMFGKIMNDFGLLNSAVVALDKAIELKKQKYDSDYIECIELRDGLKKKITSEYKEDNELLRRLVQDNSKPKHKNEGIISTYNNERGFGFIVSNEDKIFFHISNCNYKNISIGDNVKYTTIETSKGLKAINIYKTL